MHVPIYFNKFGRSKKGEKITATLRSGKKKSYRLYKAAPKGCSAVRQICIACLKVKIHGNSRFHESKICEACTSLHKAPAPHAPTSAQSNEAQQRLVSPPLRAGRSKKGKDERVQLPFFKWRVDVYDSLTSRVYEGFYYNARSQAFEVWWGGRKTAEVPKNTPPDLLLEWALSKSMNPSKLRRPNFNARKSSPLR